MLPSQASVLSTPNDDRVLRDHERYLNGLARQLREEGAFYYEFDHPKQHRLLHCRVEIREGMVYLSETDGDWYPCKPSCDLAAFAQQQELTFADIARRAGVLR